MLITQELYDTILMKSTFIAGNPSGERDPYDEEVLNTVQDVLTFLGALPLDFKEPSVYAGTTAPSDETILTLGWWSTVYSMQSVSVYFRKTGKVMFETNIDRSVYSGIDIVTTKDLIKNIRQVGKIIQLLDSPE